MGETKPFQAGIEPVALVTGASRGIGRSIAIMLAREGYRLLLVSRGREGLEETARLAGAVSGGPADGMGTIQTAAVDLSRPAAPAELIERVRSEFGRLDLLVNNAGMVAEGPIGGYLPEQWDAVMNLNARAPFFLMQASLPLLRSAEPGYIINIGSVVSKKGYAGQALYTASKHALLGMTKSAARDLAADGIRVHAILPGGVDTDMIRDVRPDIDLSQLISPEEVAEAVRFLLSQRGNGIIDEIDLRRFSKPAWD